MEATGVYWKPVGDVMAQTQSGGRGDGEHAGAQGAPARDWTRGSPNRKAGALLPSSVRVGWAIRSKAGLARTQP